MEREQRKGRHAAAAGRRAYTWTNSMPVSWQNAFQSAAWWPRFITS